MSGIADDPTGARGTSVGGGASSSPLEAAGARRAEPDRPRVNIRYRDPLTGKRVAPDAPGAVPILPKPEAAAPARSAAAPQRRGPAKAKPAPRRRQETYQPAAEAPHPLDDLLRSNEETRARSGSTDTRGRPADASPGTEEDGYIDTGITRISLDAGEANNFDIPAHLCRRGWAYRWQTTTVLGQAVDAADMGFAHRQGWQPCTDRAIRSHFMPPTWDKKTIELGGQILLTRPQRLEKEAKVEMEKKAADQTLAKMRQAALAPPEQDKRMPRRILGLDIQGETGAYKDDPLRT